MLIRAMTVQNFRCVLGATLPFEGVTTLVGRNGSGKSSFLRALSIFYTAGANVTEDDFYNNDSSRPIVIEITWDSLAPAELEAYGPYVDGSTLTVRKEINWENGRPHERYFGSRMQFQGFADVRAASSRTDKRARFNALVDSGTAPDLQQRVRSADAADEQMAQWEAAHSDLCEQLRDDGQFFGFRNVGVGKLERFTRFVYVQAVRDAADDAVEGRDSPLTELMEMIVRNVMRQNPELEQFRQETHERYSELTSPERLPQLPALSDQLTKLLQSYVVNAGVSLVWEPTAGLDVPLPRAVAELAEDGYVGDVSRKGHGLQRAFILTLLQFLTTLQARDAEDTAPDEDLPEGAAETPIPSLVLGIEEPELYQHPNRQRHLAKVFHELAASPGSDHGGATQVLLTTHSPYFVDVSRFEEVRLIRKVRAVEDEDKPVISNVTSSSLGRVVKLLETAGEAEPRTYSVDSLRQRLVSVMTPLVNEGFFADVAVLVEGEQDRAAVLGAAAAQGLDLAHLGISVIPVNGKSNLDRPYCILSELGIPCHVVFDGDKHKGERDGKPGTNRLLLSLLGVDPVDFPQSQTRDRFTCFEDSLDRDIARALGEEEFWASVQVCRDHYGYESNEHAVKCPGVMKQVIEEAAGQGRSCGLVVSIVEHARTLLNRV